MRVLGIDPGLRIAGYGCIEYEQSKRLPTLVEAGAIKLKTKQSVSFRLAQLYQDIQETIDELNIELGKAKSGQASWQGVVDTGLNDLLIKDLEEGEGPEKLLEKYNALSEVAAAIYGPNWQENIQTFGQLQTALNNTQANYKELLEEERGYQLEAIDIQMRLKDASKWKGPLGQLLTEEITQEQKLLDVNKAKLAVKAAQKALDEISEGGIGTARHNAALAAVTLAEKGVDLAEKELDIYKQSIRIGFKFANDLQAGFTQLWDNVIDGTKSLKDALKATFRQIFIQLAQMIAQMLMVKALQAAIGWWQGPQIEEIEVVGVKRAISGSGGSSFSTGGIVGEKPQYFGAGGMAKSLAKGTDTVPAMLTPGETVLTPSQLKNLVGNSAAMGTNNVTVNVSAQGQQQTTSNNSNQQAEIGRMIADAVTATLIEEQRPGGVLSPFGGGGP